MRTVAVLGAGSWGTALAVHLGRVGHAVHLWARDRALAERIGADRVNGAYLPGVTFPESVRVTDALEAALRGADLVVCAIPSHGCRGVMRAAAPHIRPGATIVSATKGLEADTLLRMSQVIAAEIRGEERVVVLSGPTFASEVAAGLPTAVLVASADAGAAEIVQEEFRGASVRLYASSDVIGVEMGGASKNVIAIAAGVVEGLGLGHNALAALITRGLAEITRLACAVGGRRETLAGLSGLGDLVLTCTGALSRNRYVGIELTRGRSVEDIVKSMRMVAEGVRTTGAILALGARHHVELPIAAQMHEVLTGQTDVRAGVEALMLRRQRAEAEAV